MGAPTNTYNSAAELALGNVPSDIDTPEGLYRELLDLHNAIEGLVTFTGEENTSLIQEVTAVAALIGKAITNLNASVRANLDVAQEVSISIALNGKVRANLNIHVKSKSAHGVTGENVGTEDFATELIGGVALLSTLLTDAPTSSEAVASADASVAPVAYDQTQMQEVVDLVNECKAVINTFIGTDYNDFITDKFNSLLAKLKTAKQMNTT